MPISGHLFLLTTLIRCFRAPFLAYDFHTLPCVLLLLMICSSDTSLFSVPTTKRGPVHSAPSADITSQIDPNGVVVPARVLQILQNGWVEHIPLDSIPTVPVALLPLW
jgi:hypothetical protein